MKKTFILMMLVVLTTLGSLPTAAQPGPEQRVPEEVIEAPVAEPPAGMEALLEESLKAAFGDADTTPQNDPEADRLPEYLNQMAESVMHWLKHLQETAQEPESD